MEKGSIYFEENNSLNMQVEYISLNVPHFSSFFGAWFLLCDEHYFNSSKFVHKNSISVSLSSAIIDGDVYIRTKKPQDSYRVHKMTRKLKTLFQSLHLPCAKTNKIPVFCDEKGILFVPPFGIREENDRTLMMPTVNYYLVIAYLDSKAVPWLD